MMFSILIIYPLIIYFSKLRRMDIKNELKNWVKDLLEVAVTLAVIIIVSKLLFGAKMLVPLVAVTSNSMLHTSDEWRGWLTAGGVPESQINSFPLQGGFSQGDMVLTITPNGEGTILPIFPDTQVGDVIIYNRDRLHRGNEPIIHRVVGIVYVTDWKVIKTEGVLDCLDEEDFDDRYIRSIQECRQGGRCPYNEIPADGNFRFYITKGDNNHGSDQCGPGNGIALPVPDSQLTARGWIRIPYLGWLKLGLNAILGL